MMFININTCIGILFQIAFITNMHFHTWKIRSFQMQKDTKLFNLRLVHIMLFSFWTFSSLIFGYVILWAPEGIQIGNRMLLSKTSICMWRTETSLVKSPILDLLWNLDQWCILAWKACKKNQICRQFVYWGNYTNAFPNLIFIINRQ